MIENYPLFIDGLFVEDIITQEIRSYLLQEIEIKNMLKSEKWRENLKKHENMFSQGVNINQTIKEHIGFLSYDLPWSICIRNQIKKKYGEKGISFYKMHIGTGIKPLMSKMQDRIYTNWIKFNKARTLKYFPRISYFMVRRKLKLPKIIYSMSNKRVQTFSGVLLLKDYEVL